MSSEIIVPIVHDSKSCNSSGDNAVSGNMMDMLDRLLSFKLTVGLARVEYVCAVHLLLNKIIGFISEYVCGETAIRLTPSVMLYISVSKQGSCDEYDRHSNILIRMQTSFEHGDVIQQGKKIFSCCSSLVVQDNIEWQKLEEQIISMLFSSELMTFSSDNSCILDNIDNGSSNSSCSSK